MTRGNSTPEIAEGAEAQMCSVLDRCPPPSAASIPHSVRSALRGGNGAFYPCGAYPAARSSGGGGKSGGRRRSRALTAADLAAR